MTPKKKDVKTVKISKKTNSKTSKSPKKVKNVKKSELSTKTETKLKVSKLKPKSPKSTPSSKPSNVPKKTKANSKATKSKPIKKSKISKLSLRKKAIQGSSKLRSKILKKRTARIPKKYQVKSTRGVVYLKNIPHGFYEVEMKSFFNQFGQVTGVKIPRSKRTGKYRGYAFVEFLYPDVAKIAAETMNGYLMYKRLIKAKYLPSEEQKSYAFKFPAFKVPLTERRKRYLRQRSNRILTEKENEKEKKRVEKCVQKKINKLKKLNIDYQFQVVKQGTEKSTN